MDVQLTIDVPEGVARQPASDLAGRARTLLILDEVRFGRLTRAGAARVLAMSLDDLLLLAARHGIDTIDQPVEDLRRELEDVARRGF